MTFIDTHFHLDKYQAHSTFYEEINQLKQYTLCVTCNPRVYLSCKKLYPETKYVKFALGIHPQEICDSSQAIYDFDLCFVDAKYIGEVGLDYSNNAANKEAQEIVFRHIMQRQSLSKKLVSIHIRQAEADVIRILDKTPSLKRIIHWYTGNDTFLNELIQLGCYFSINPAMIRNVNQRYMLMRIPYNRILIESDGPYTNINGVRYRPKMLENVYSAIAAALAIPDLEKLVYSNFSRIL